MARLNPAQRVLHGLVELYRRGISPVLPPHCRYFPTCSEYAQEAITRHGALRGGWLALRRMSRCHPWGSSGYDPVPDAGDRAGQHTAARR